MTTGISGADELIVAPGISGADELIVAPGISGANELIVASGLAPRWAAKRPQNLTPRIA